MKNSIGFTFFLLLLLGKANAQTTTDTLTLGGYFAIIKQYHPVAQQAKLLADLAKAKKLKALGAFDPKLEAEYDQKYYGGSEYYSFFSPQIKLPLWYGLALKGSYTQATGKYINPENKVPTEGLGYAGVNFELGKGLLMDERRAGIKQANIFAQASANEKTRILNDLFFEAGASYIDWNNKFKIAKIYLDAVELATLRFESVKLSFLNGDKPAIDTLEALLIVQQRETMLQQANLDLQSAKILLANNLWLQEGQAANLDELNVSPQENLALPLAPLTTIENNPKLLSYSFKLNDLATERKLKQESLKPELGFQLGVLNQGTSLLRNINADYWAGNNKVNIRFSFPLTLSKARGDLAETKIKINQTQFEKQNLQNELLNKTKENIYQLQVLQSQVNLLVKTYQTYVQLLKGEELKFKYGESSLFLINSRESKLIEAREKQLTTEAKLQKCKIKSWWLNGTMLEMDAY